jgi:glycosyltransferase involved in cell wall biosynthesis
MLIEFCLPIYNEEKILEKNTLELFKFCHQQNFNFEWYINLVINGSSDNSFQIAKNLSKKYTAIHCREIQKNGKGRAIKTAWAESASDIFIYMDMDMSIPLSCLPRLIFKMTEGDKDLVWGSRLLKKSETERNLFRTLISKTYNLLSRIILNHQFSDLQCGFKAIKNKSLQKTILPLVKNNNWFFDTEIIIWSNIKNFKLQEIPICWKENYRKKRKSKIKPFKDSLIFFKNLIKLKKEIKKST